MRTFTRSEENNGELAARRLSEKAQKVYNDTEPLTVYEYDDPEQDADDINENGHKKLYAYSGAFGNADGLTFDELQTEFEAISDELNEEN